MSISKNPKYNIGELSFQARLVCVGFLLSFAAFALSLNIGPFSDFAAWLLFAQDRWLLLAEALVLLAATIGLKPGTKPIRLSGRVCLALALVAAPLCYLGYIWVLCGYDMSRDEQMAVFDSRIFAHGLLFQPLPAAWQTHIVALNSLFLLPAKHPVGWVSDYLPVNAALRALVGTVLDPAWTGPCLTAVGAVALWGCARRLWPDDEEAPALATLLYLGSAQVLFAGMSAYAMPALLTFNLVWLWLFLNGRRWSDGAALIVGAFAVGLHQPLFHPIFVAPFVALLLWRRDWRRAAVFLIGYALICGFWLAWPHWMYARIEGGHPATTAAGVSFWARLRDLLGASFEHRWTDLTANLLRFTAWQPILLLPLFGAGLAVARRNATYAALAATVILPVLVMAVLMPDQWQGFGYRYLHGVIGAAILVAIQGWRDLVVRVPAWRPLLVRTLVGGVLIVLPLQIFLTRSYNASVASVDRRIAASGTDYFLIGSNDAPAANGLVINRADLSNRPLRLFAETINPDLIHQLCDRGASVALPTSAFYAPINHYFHGTLVSHVPDRRAAILGPQLLAAGCHVVRIGGESSGAASRRTYDPRSAL